MTGRRGHLYTMLALPIICEPEEVLQVSRKTIVWGEEVLMGALRSEQVMGSLSISPERTQVGQLQANGPITGFFFPLPSTFDFNIDLEVHLNCSQNSRH